MPTATGVALGGAFSTGTNQSVSLINTSVEAALAAKVAAELAETNAETAETNAASSANSAATSASTATTKANLATSNGAAQVTLATQQVTLATAQKAIAVTKASEASTSASTASTQATNASNSATASANSATASANSASSLGNSVTAAANSATAAAASFDSFDDRYLGAKSSNPSVDNDGNSLITGALYFNSSAGQMRVYGGSSWVAAGSAVNGTSARVVYTATANQTSFSVTYNAGFVDVYLNGIKLLLAVDYVGTSGTAVVLSTGATVGDIVDIVAYGAFNLANHYTKTEVNSLFGYEIDGGTATSVYLSSQLINGGTA